MDELPSAEQLKQRLRTTATRPYRHEQGDVVYGVRSFNYKTGSDVSEWVSTGKVFTERQRAEDYFEDDHPLMDKNKHDVVLYRGVVAIADSQQGRDSFVIAPDEETEMVLTELEILKRSTPQEQK